MEISNLSEKQSFYIAVILYESSSTKPEYKPLYQECFVLIKATSVEEAREKALSHASQEQVSYQNEKGDTITWSLKQVVDVNSVLYDEFDDFTELYARHFRNYEAYRLFESLLSDSVSEL
ncbi:MAG: hypothetical protein Fur006_60820 [Coleofasciculaceae cyanobacterium]